MKRCQACMLPDTFPNIVIDDEGICNRCKEQKQLTYKGEDELLERVQWRKGAQYDCVIPISGGKDSTYALYVMRRKLGLRTLAVNHHNRMSNGLARDNIKKVCEELDVDLLIVETESDAERKFVYHFLKAMVPLGISWGICSICFYGIGSAVYRAAMRHKIPSILWAITPYEMLPFFPRHKWDEMKFSEVDFNIKDHFHLEFNPFIIDPLKRNASPMKLLNAARHLSMAMYHLVKQRTELYVPPFSNFFGLKPKLKSDDIREFMIYQYVPYDGRVIEETLQKEIGWKKPEDRKSSERYDCMIAPLNDVRWRNAYDVSMGSLFSAAQTRAGLRTKEQTEQIIRESQLNETYKKRLQTLFDAVGLKDVDMSMLIGPQQESDLPENPDMQVTGQTHGCLHTS